MARIVSTLVVLLTASFARRAPAQDLASFFERAERLEQLDPFLERVIGRCLDPYAKAACESAATSARKNAAEKVFVVKVSDATPLIRPEIDGDRYVLLLTPFLDGGGFALTNGAPLAQDKNGNPVVKLLPIRGRLPPGALGLEFLSPFRTGAVELEVVFRPTNAWKLPKKGGGFVQGLGSKFLAVRLFDARTGKEIAAQAL